MIKKGWKPATGRIQQTYNEVRVEALRLYPDVTIPEKCYISPKMGGHTLGSYKYESVKPKTEPYYSYRRNFINDNIVISHLVNQVDINELYNLIIHEIAHCVANKHCHYSCKHDCNWETIGNNIGKKWNQKVTQHVTNKEVLTLMNSQRPNNKIKLKTYKIYCNSCHREDLVTRNTYLHCSDYTCTTCHQKMSQVKDFSKPKFEKRDNDFAELEPYLGKNVTYISQNNGGTWVNGKLIGLRKYKGIWNWDSYWLTIIPTRCKKPKTYELMDISNFAIFEGKINIYDYKLLYRNFDNEIFKQLLEDKANKKNILFVNYHKSED